jgi:hypothetical protein
MVDDDGPSFQHPFRRNSPHCSRLRYSHWHLRFSAETTDLNMHVGKTSTSREFDPQTSSCHRLGVEAIRDAHSAYMRRDTAVRELIDQGRQSVL